jgi:hypothetical protein
MTRIGNHSYIMRFATRKKRDPGRAKTLNRSGDSAAAWYIALVTALRTIAAICFSSLLALSACSGKAGGGGPGDDDPDASNPGGDPDGGDTKPPDAGLDTDGDGLPDDRELELGTDPKNPDSDGDGLNDGDEIDFGSDPNNPDSDGDGFTDGEEVGVIGTNPANPGCENQNAEASQGKLPADIIIVMDNSSSMGQEADAIEENINNDLAGILEAGEVDYRIILLADFPPVEVGGRIDAGDPTVCIQPPPEGGITLQDNNCAALGTQTKPNNFAPGGGLANPRFAHYDTPVDSNAALRVLLTEFDDPAGDLGTTGGSGATPAQFPGGYGQLLRENAIRIFISITDDETTGVEIALPDLGDPADPSDDVPAVNEFETGITSGPGGTGTVTVPGIRAKLQAKFAGGTPELRYIAHGILALASKPPPDTSAWQPDEPVQTTTCSPGAQDEGTLHQILNILTGGLRFPLCSVNDTNPDNDNFDEIFNAIAENVKTETNLPCSFSPAARDPGLPPLNYQGAKLIYRDGDTSDLELFIEVDDVSMCGTTDNAFYKVGSDTAPESFELCPATCDRVEADLAGKINLLIDCELQIG